MYYRYEGRVSAKDPWVGICALMNPDERREVGKFLAEPQWYKKNTDIPSTCWFTEYGYLKYHRRVESIIKNMYRSIEFRILKNNTLDYIVSKGKVQCITTMSLPEDTKEKLIILTARGRSIKDMV